MAVLPGYYGNVASWGSPNDAILALISPMRMGFSIPSAALEGTGFNTAGGGTIVRTFNKGLRDWTAQLSGHTVAPIGGHLGNFTGTNIYATTPRSYQINIMAAAEDSTSFQPTGNWREFTPTLVSWDATWEAMLNQATPLVSVPDADDATVASFIATISSGNTLAGNCVVTQAEPSEEVGGLAIVRYTGQGTGHLTLAGSANIMAPNSGTMLRPIASSLVAKVFDSSGTDRTLTGSAFWTRISINATVGQQTTFEIDVRGTGALTPA